MKINLFNRFAIWVERVPEYVTITKEDVVKSIIDLYDEHVKEHGVNAKSVYWIATKKHVADRLGVAPHRIDPFVEGNYGYAKFKEQVLVAHGRGHIQNVETTYHGKPWQFQYFRPTEIDNDGMEM